MLLKKLLKSKRESQVKVLTHKVKVFNVSKVKVKVTYKGNNDTRSGNSVPYTEGTG